VRGNEISGMKGKKVTEFNYVPKNSAFWKEHPLSLANSTLSLVLFLTPTFLLECMCIMKPYCPAALKVPKRRSVRVVETPKRKNK
jgi:hypothetical protein